MLILMLMINTLFMFMNHPMSMGLILIVQTIIISISAGMMMKTFWMSYILVISMLSGMLVLFIYMSSVASNEKFKKNNKMWVYFIMATLMAGMFLFLMEKMIIKNNYWGMEMTSMKLSEIYFLNKMFNKNNMLITIMLVMYLFMTMIAASFLVNISEGPMRMKTNYV